MTVNDELESVQLFGRNDENYEKPLDIECPLRD
jgi:hypothetical protein